MSFDWQPDLNRVGEIVELIKFTQSSNNNTQQKAFVRFNELQKNSDFAAYAAVIFGNNNLDISIRRHAGLILKECLRKNLKHMSSDSYINDNILSICKCTLLQCLTTEYSTLENKFIASTSAVAIASIIRETSSPDLWDTYYGQNSNSNEENTEIEMNFEAWPDLISKLLQILNKYQNRSNCIVINSVLHTISILAEDRGYILGKCAESESLISALLSFAKHPNVFIRILSIKSLYFLFQFQPNSLLIKIEEYAHV